VRGPSPIISVGRPDMITTMTPSDFRALYGINASRLALLGALDAFLHALQEEFRSSRVLAYGSFITEKDQPGDIDVMVVVCSTPTDPGFAKRRQLQELASAEIDVFTLRLSMGSGPKTDPPPAADMVEMFNGLERHVTKGIRCSHAIELVLTGPGGIDGKRANDEAPNKSPATPEIPKPG
jgi:predicted nucleotidyltransferase